MPTSNDICGRPGVVTSNALHMGTLLVSNTAGSQPPTHHCFHAPRSTGAARHRRSSALGGGRPPPWGPPSGSASAESLWASGRCRGFVGGRGESRRLVMILDWRRPLADQSPARHMMRGACKLVLWRWAKGPKADPARPHRAGWTAHDWVREGAAGWGHQGKGKGRDRERVRPQFNPDRRVLTEDGCRH